MDPTKRLEKMDWIRWHNRCCPLPNSTIKEPMHVLIKRWNCRKSPSLSYAIWLDEDRGTYFVYKWEERRRASTNQFPAGRFSLPCLKSHARDYETFETNFVEWMQKKGFDPVVAEEEPEWHKELRK